MVILIALFVGMSFWIVAWSLGFGGFDPFLVVVGLVLAAAAYRIAAPYIKQMTGRT